MILAPNTSGNTAKEIKKLNMRYICSQVGNPSVKGQTRN